MPYAQDWYVLLQMYREAPINTDTMSLSGHTIVGNIYNEHLFEGSLPRNEVLTVAARYHLLFQGGHDT